MTKTRASTPQSCIVDTRIYQGARGPGANSTHRDDADADEPLVADAVLDWIAGELAKMVSQRGNDAAEAAGDVCERLTALVREIADRVAGEKRAAWVREELAKDRAQSGASRPRFR